MERRQVRQEAERDVAAGSAKAQAGQKRKAGATQLAKASKRRSGTAEGATAGREGEELVARELSGKLPKFVELLKYKVGTAGAEAAADCFPTEVLASAAVRRWLMTLIDQPLQQPPAPALSAALTPYWQTGSSLSFPRCVVLNLLMTLVHARQEGALSLSGSLFSGSLYIGACGRLSQA